MKTITISAMESFTGGAFAKRITKIPGSSKYFLGSMVTYSTELKNKFGVDTTDGVVSKKTALSMSMQSKKITGSDVSFAFTGEAGPISSSNNPVGKVFIAMNDKVIEKIIIGNRSEIIKKSIDIAIKMFLEEYGNSYINI